MTNNDQILLAQVLAERSQQQVLPLPADEAFEIFAAEQALKEYELTEDEIVEGIVGGGNDGGFDGVYTFLNDVLVSDDAEVLDPNVPHSRLPKEARLELTLVQAKQTSSFSETAMDKAKASIGKLLDLNAAKRDLDVLFSAAIIDRVLIFRRALLKLVSRNPKVRIKFVYATKGDTAQINTKVVARAEMVKSEMRNAFSKATPEVIFLGAVELWELATSTASYSLELAFQEQLGLKGSHIALVQLKDYLLFITDEDGSLRRYIFDSNVRDWEGGVEVNKEITASLLAASGPDIWWLNNGVTIICSSATSIGSNYRLEDVQVVNGLQTSFSIYNALKDLATGDPRLERHVVVRILSTSDEDYRDRVIRATNRQTRVPDASLRATDPFHRRIEDYLSANGLYYDRRKNYYKNTGKPTTKIISITYLAQALLAVVLAEPNTARARPSSVLKDDAAYNRIFDPTTDLAVYLYAVSVQRLVDAYLLSNAVDAQERTNLRFALATLVVSKLVGNIVRAPGQLSKLAEARSFPSQQQIADSLLALRSIVVDERKKHPSLTFDQLVKGQIILDRVIAAGTPAKSKGKSK